MDAGETDAALVRAFHAAPFGPHDAALASRLAPLRAGDLAGKLCLICVRPHRAWVIGRLSGVRGVPPQIEPDPVFASLAEAEWAIFRRRWRDTHGRDPLPDEP